MSISSQLTAVRYYTAADVYYYLTDNRPISDNAQNITSIATYIDKMNPGRVDVTGGATPVVNAIPTGWTITRTGAGAYTVTHNLNLTANAYSVIGNCYGPEVFYPSALGANSFVVNTVNLSGVATDTQFVCVLTEI